MWSAQECPFIGAINLYSLWGEGGGQGREGSGDIFEGGGCYEREEERKSDSISDQSSLGGTRNEEVGGGYPWWEGICCEQGNVGQS